VLKRSYEGAYLYSAMEENDFVHSDHVHSICRTVLSFGERPESGGVEWGSCNASTMAACVAPVPDRSLLVGTRPIESLKADSCTEAENGDILLECNPVVELYSARSPRIGPLGDK
jgi:hypothetical protein